LNYGEIRKAYVVLRTPLAKNSKIILDYLMEVDETMSAGEIEMRINEIGEPYLPQSCVSMTLNRLLDAGYLNVEPVGSQRLYSLDWDHIVKVNRIAKALNLMPVKVEAV